MMVGPSKRRLIKETFASDCGKACAVERRVWAPNDKDVQMFLIT